MKMRKLLAALAAPALLTAGLLWADEEAEKAEFSATCPVSGQPAIEDSALEYQGKKLYFCCENCPAAYKADPEKYTAKANYQLLQTAQIVQVACPFTGGDMNPDTATEIGTVKVAFCCENCQGKAQKAEGDEQLALIFGDISKGFTLQTECPVSGQPIDVAQSVEHEGQKVYFCCENCPAAFTADPAKFLDKLPQFAEAAAE